MQDPLLHSRLGLVGSGEFTDAMLSIDREILATIGRTPTVVILPTAAAGEDPEDWAYRGVEHFRKLGARSVGLMVLDRTDAEDPRNAEVVQHADLLYISGGKTARLLAALEGSPLWQAFLLARESGAWLVGSSAGAMALGDWSLVHRPEDGDGTPTLWTPGLGMLQGYAVVPHFDGWTESRSLVEKIVTACNVFGVDEDTALLLEDGQALVAGKGEARLFARGTESRYGSGDRFELESAS